MCRRRASAVAALCLGLLVCISSCDALPPCIDQRSQHKAFQVTADCRWTGTAGEEQTVSGELNLLIQGSFAIVLTATESGISTGAIGPFQHATGLVLKDRSAAAVCCMLSATQQQWSQDGYGPLQLHQLRCCKFRPVQLR
jgi:hypothetical protein